jgi:hypothetical protein
MFYTLENRSDTNPGAPYSAIKGNNFGILT